MGFPEDFDGSDRGHMGIGLIQKVLAVQLNATSDWSSDLLGISFHDGGASGAGPRVTCHVARDGRRRLNNMGGNASGETAPLRSSPASKFLPRQSLFR